MNPTKLELTELENIIEAALIVAGRPLTATHLQALFEDESLDDIRNCLNHIRERYESRGIELKELASGFQFQAKASLSPWLSKLWQERPPRYSRALLETLALIAYKQPITRAEIEETRGVTVSSHIIKTLLEHEWVRIVGFKEVPGKPALYATTKHFLDHFNLKKLDELPALIEINNLDNQEARLQIELNLSAQSSDNSPFPEHENTDE